jgi:8-oxo-dGTP pyrophosphatase MutT (NUDIX family)
MHFDDEQIRSALEPLSSEWRSRAGLRDAAVLAALVRGEQGDCLLLTQRHSDLPHHAGEVAFPGGRRDGNESALACALRETEEEIGLGAEQFELLGRIPPRVSIAGFFVQVFVARLSSLDGLRPDPREVDEVFTIPFEALRDESGWSWRGRKHGDAHHRIPYFPWEGKMLWGLTGIFTQDLLERLAPSRG